MNDLKEEIIKAIETLIEKITDECARNGCRCDIDGSGGHEKPYEELLERVKKATLDPNTDLYCPACGECYSFLIDIAPGSFEFQCPNCDTDFEIRIGFYEKG